MKTILDFNSFKVETSLGIHFRAAGCLPKVLQIKLHPELATRGPVSAVHVLETIKTILQCIPTLLHRAQIHYISSLSIAYFQIPFYTLIKLLLGSEELKKFWRITTERKGRESISFEGNFSNLFFFFLSSIGIPAVCLLCICIYTCERRADRWGDGRKGWSLGPWSNFNKRPLCLGMNVSM